MINWPTPSYVGEIYTSPNGSGWIWNGYGWDTIGGNPSFLYAEIQPDPADIRALPGQSYELLPAPGAGKYLDIFKIIVESKPVTADYDYVSAKSLYFSYADMNYSSLSNYIGAISLSVGTDLWTGSLASFSILFPYGNGVNPSVFKQNKPLYVGIDNANDSGNNATVGDHIATFKIMYSIKNLS
jgi:hypothetical protein